MSHSRATGPLQGENSEPVERCLNLLIPKIGEGYRQTITYLIANRARNANTASLRQTLEPDRDINSVAMEIVSLSNDITEIDADAPNNASILRGSACSKCRTLLNFDRRTHCFDRAWKLHENAIPIVLTTRPLWREMIGLTSSSR